MVAEALEHGSLARADLTSQDDKPLAALDTVDQAGEGFFVLCAAIQKRGVRAQIERRTA